MRFFGQSDYDFISYISPNLIEYLRAYIMHCVVLLNSSNEQLKDFNGDVNLLTNQFHSKLYVSLAH